MRVVRRTMREGETMDKNEIIALSIVVVAVVLVIRYFIKQKGGGCCSKDCLPSGRPKEPSEKK